MSWRRIWFWTRGLTAGAVAGAGAGAAAAGVLFLSGNEQERQWCSWTVPGAEGGGEEAGKILGAEAGTREKSERTGETGTIVGAGVKENHV